MEIHKIFLTSLLAIAPLVADPCLPKEPTPCCKKPDPCPFPEKDRCIQGYATLDLIWWKPYIGSMEYAITGVNDRGTNVAQYMNVKKGYIHEPDFAFKPGFKIGLGAQLPHDDWTLCGQYTWLQGGVQNNSFTAKEWQGAITALDVVGPTGAIGQMSVQSGSSSWKQSFNVVDLMLGKVLFASPYLSLKPSIGLKTAWIREKLQLNYATTAAQIDIDEVVAIEEMRKQTMWGIGSRFGLDGIWFFTKHWGIYGNFDATALWSDFHSRAKTDTVTEIVSDVFVTSTNLNTKRSSREVMGIFEMSFGLTYKIWIEDRQYRFQAWLGWEEQIWMNFNHFVENPKSGNLSLQGVTLKAALMF
jgi:hypothetical protein